MGFGQDTHRQYSHSRMYIGRIYLLFRFVNIKAILISKSCMVKRKRFFLKIKRFIDFFFYGDAIRLKNYHSFDLCIYRFAKI